MAAAKRAPYMTNSEEREPLDGPARRALRLEAYLVYALSAALTLGLVLLGRVVPFIGQNVVALVALVFLYLPVVALRRRGLDAADFGLDRSLLVRGARLGLLLTAITLPPFLVGFHLWETIVFDNRLDITADNYRALPEQLRTGPPAIDRDGLSLWRRQRHLVMQWVGDGPWTIDVETDGELIHRGGTRPEIIETDSATAHWRFERRDGGEVIFWARGGPEVIINATRDGHTLEPSELWAGGGFGTIEASDPIVLDRSWTWIPLSLLIQLLLVALPEEFFYRGYLQARLDRINPRRFRLGPFHTSPAILTTSLLFALGHFIIGLDPVRLSVFFPSLVFGWLRDRSGGLGASILYHAACNLMVELTIVHYWPA